MPLVEPLVAPFWPESDRLPADDLPAIAPSSPTRSAAGLESSPNWIALDQVLGELRSLLKDGSARRGAGQLYVREAQSRIHKVADELVGGATRLGRDVLADWRWLDDLFSSLGEARDQQEPASRVNLPPLAMGELYRVASGASLSVGGRGVLANDFDPNGDALSASLVRGPAHAADFRLAADGSFSYTPAPGFAGIDRFSYRVSDGQLADEGQVTFSVLSGGNQAPVADNDSATTSEDTLVTVEVLNNDYDPDGHAIHVVAVTDPGSGTATFTSASVTYTPDWNWSGTESFDYTIVDGHGGTATASVQVTVLPVDDSPTAEPDYAMTTEGVAVQIPVLLGDWDPEGSVSLVWVQPWTSNGNQVVNNGNGWVTFTPWYYQDPEYPEYSYGFTGFDSFTYTIEDGTGQQGYGCVQVYVADPDIDDLPWALPDEEVTDEDTPVNISVLANDLDAEGPVTLLSASVAYGQTAINPDGSITYTPWPDFHGPAQLGYEIRDSYGNTAWGTGEVLVRSVNDAPVADDDIAFTGKDAWIEIYSLIGDIDPDNVFQPDSNPQIVSDATQPTNGTVWFSASSVFYEPDANYVPGSQTVPYTFQYTMVDGHGGSSTAEVGITMVDVTDYTLEWLNPDSNWEVVQPGEVSWSHDTLRWTPHFAPFDPPDAYLVDWKAIAWPNRSQPLDQWSTFASGDPFLPTEGNPGVGDWAITPLVHFYYYDEQAQQMSQTGFAVAMADPPEKIIAEITSVRWQPHSVPEQAAELVDDGWNLRVFPDAPAPGGSARTMVDVVATVSPQKPGIPFFMDWFDVDDGTDHDGPVDTDPTDTDVNPSDNRSTDGFGNTHFVNLTSPCVTDANGQVRATLDIGPIQPGNNLRIAAAGRCEEIARVKPLARDAISGLFYDADGDGVLNVNAGETAFTESTSSAFVPARASRLLTVWRRLHVEVDSMGAVVGNVFQNSIVNVVEDDGVTCKVMLGSPLSNFDPNQFEYGRLRDRQGSLFAIKESHLTDLIVYDNEGVTPTIGSPAYLEDDDWNYFPQGRDVPMPDTSELGSAMAEAFVDVRFDVGDSNNDVQFRLNVDTTWPAMDWDSVGQNSVAFWVAYVLGAFQFKTIEDHDPNTQPATFGTTRVEGGSLIYLETLVDYARDAHWDRVAVEQDAVVHEVGHAVSGKGDEPVTLWPTTPSRYTENYLQGIRSSQKPAASPP